MRAFIGDRIQIDGRMIEYRLINAADYFLEKGVTEEELDEMYQNQYDMMQKINQIMALKQSCYLLRRTSHSCGSLANDLYTLKERLIQEVKDQHGYEFDDAFVESFGE